MSRAKQQPLEHRLLLTATLCLLAGGAVMVYSSSSARTLLAGQGDGTSYLVKYLIFGGVGLVLMHALSRYGLSAIRKMTRPLLFVSFGLLAAVLLPGIGISVNGASRWLGAGPIQFQPSELMKLALVLHCAAVFAARPKLSRELRLAAVPILGVSSLAILLVAGQPDLGTILVIAMTVGAMLVAAGMPMRQIGLLAGSGSVLVLIFVMMAPYRRGRLTSFLDPWSDMTHTGFQAVQGQIAIGSGGWLGLGPGQSVQKIFYLPEAHTDFILAVIGEELGFVGITVLIVLYGVIAYAGLRTAKAAKGTYAKLLAAGITSLIICQALLNVYAVLGLAPLTGVPLPFISSGSSSLIVLLCAMGILLNIAAGGSAHLRVVGNTRDAGSRNHGEGRVQTSTIKKPQTKETGNQDNRKQRDNREPQPTGTKRRSKSSNAVAKGFNSAQGSSSSKRAKRPSAG